MTDAPLYPLILLDKTGGLDLIDNEGYLSKTNVLGYLKGSFKGLVAYGPSETTWALNKVSTDYPINGLAKFLAYTIYNPFIDITFQWKKGKTYELVDLKDKIAKQIDLDDDVLTQFEEAEIIKNEIDRCRSFEEVVVVLSKYIFKVNEGELLREQALRK